ncbi:MAG: sodium:proton antiporter [Proteobacteria bacterium]|nr:sodium:proton antiporter [Pseudomonadota bacterium]MDA1057714.1 sodium:proton antiporter [Pseudomonadota bacterium]
MTNPGLINIATAVFTLAAVFGYINHRWLKLPTTIGLVVIAMMSSLCVIALDSAFPELNLRDTARAAFLQIDFHETLMQGLLSFLLFAGALHVNLDDLIARKWAIGSLATAGVLISTALNAIGVYYLARVLGIDIPFAWALVFGALISPTDPVAVLGILKTVPGVPDSLRAKIAGESLFNDGVGVVVFAILLAVALGGGAHGGEPIGALGIAELFVVEALGGALLGLVTGLVAFYAIKSIDEYNLEIMITLSLVMLTYGIATLLHLSGPIAVVIAGLLIGNHGTRLAMSDRSREHVETFWALLDEILNAALFLLIGFEVIALSFSAPELLGMLLAIPLAVFARFVSVSIPIAVLGLRQTFTKGAIPVLTWGGLKGGISVALALSLPDFPAREPILAITYGVVIFSIIVQGLSIRRVVRIAVR